MSRAKRVLSTSLVAVTLLLAVYVAWFATRAPSQDAQWLRQYQVHADIHLSGDTLYIRKLRDFRYDDGGSVTEARYVDRRYQLSSLKAVWFGLSHFSGYGLAHAFASFEFSDGQFLAVSIEARLRRDQEQYNPLLGALREYTKFVVLGTEEDIIGVRSHIRENSVYLYPLKGSSLQGHALLLNFLRRADNLSHTPDFYNTLTDNCLTGLLAESGRYNDLHHWLDYRILLPGYADEVLFDHGLIDTENHLAKTRLNARVSSAISPDEQYFSRKIRQGWRVESDPVSAAGPDLLSVAYPHCGSDIGVIRKASAMPLPFEDNAMVVGDAVPGGLFRGGIGEKRIPFPNIWRLAGQMPQS